MKISRIELESHLEWEELVNDTPFEDLDLSEFEIQPKKEHIKKCKLIGVSNMSLIRYMLREEKQKYEERKV